MANRKMIAREVPAVAREMKRHGWDNRSATARFGLGGLATGVALFGGKTAGLAALGTAIAVPLWVVFGGGAALAHVLYDELGRTSPTTSDIKTTYKVIDAEKDDGST